jgi:predicted DCC family thiol-disulfide oxidoreductase YuxK
MEHITAYAFATLHVNQAHNAPNMTFTVDQYIAQRSSNAAGPALHHLSEYVHDLKIPDSVFEMEAMRTVVKEGAIMAQIVNDLLSLNKEVKQEPDSVSLITVLMQQRGLTPQQAVNSAVELLREIQRRFVEAEKPVKDGIRDRSEKVQRDVRQFIGTGNDWVVGALKWSYETPRYMNGARVLENVSVLFLLGGNAQLVKEEGEKVNPLQQWVECS